MTTRVTDVRHGLDALPGQQRETIGVAEVAVQMISGATVVVVFSFAEKPEGKGWNVEVGIAGSGPLGFGKVVEDTLAKAANSIGLAMAEQERQALAMRQADKA